ncbi:MAG: hypothetical protein M3296_05165 [Actinomycetota bacterium]|nr:hypothetical protein [Actinomycetota bacterium]
MVFAVAAFMSLGATSALATGTGGSGGNGKPSGCSGPGNSTNHRQDCNHPKKCRKGEVRRHGKCVPKPKKCAQGEEKVRGKCVPKCKDDEVRDRSGHCQPKPAPCENNPCQPPPKDGPCANADLVLLEDLFRGTGALVCLYLGDNAPNATQERDCPDSLIALPVDNLVGACVYLPPADVDRSGRRSGPGLAALTSKLEGILG